MAIRNVGFRLQSEGKAEIKNDFAEVRAAGVAAMDGVADAAEDAARRATAANDDFTKRQLDGWKKQADAAKLNAARADVRSSFDDTLGRSGNVNLDRSTGQARASAEVFEAHARAQDEAAAAALKLKAAVDPLWAAEDRLASELAQVALAEKAGILTADQLGDAQARARKRFDETTDAIKRQGTANTGLSKMQRQTLIYTASDIVASSASGASPAMIAMQQGPQVLQAFAAEEGGMAALRATLTGTAAAIGAVTIAAGVGAMAWNDYTSSAAKLSAAARGTGVMLGLSGDELMRNAQTAADAGKISVSSARDLEMGYLGVARSGDVLVKLTAITRDYAAATGQDMAGAQRELATAFADPIAGADDLAGKYGVLTQAQVEQITKLAEQNDLAGAQRVLLEALGPAFVGAADNANALARGWENIKNAASDAWNWMGRALDRMATGGTIAQRIQDLQRQRQQGPTVGQMLFGTSTAEFQAGIDRQIAGLNQQLRQEAARSAAARSNAAQAAAQGVVDRYAGDQRGALRADAARLRAALKTDLPADQRAQITATLGAYTNALDTWMPKQEKANRLAAIDAQIAAAKTPAAKAALASERSRVEMAGQLATSADVESRATSAATRARESATKSGDKHAESLRRQAESMEASARAALDVADAYLKSSAAGITAEARRKALTDATRRGIDVEAQVRRQLNLQVADGVANGGKALAQVRDETEARQAILAQYRDGKISLEGMSTALADEAALRPLLRLRTIAQGDALTALNKVIDAYREGLEKAHDAESQFGLEKALSQSIDKAEEAKSVIADLARAPLDQVLNAASRAANIEADGLKLEPGSEGRQKLVRARLNEAEQGYNERRARYASDAARSQADALALTQREFELVAANDNVRAAELDKLRTEQDIRRQFPDMAQADIDARLAGIDAQAQANEQLKIAAAGLAEIRDFGSQLVDDALDPSKWEDWGSASKSVLEMIKGEFIALALLNPLKNMINGNSNLPTISSALSSIGGLFGGGSFDGSAIRNGANAALNAIPRNATGTEHHSGGLTYVHENGGEIMDLPTGTRIYPAAESRRMMAANDTMPRRQQIDISLNTPLFTATVSDTADQRIGVHAPGIAAGGAELGRDQMRKAQRRQMGRRGSR